MILDDTFNSNPAGAARALEALSAAGPDGRRIVVTPGMVELGPRQHAENAAFARAASLQATDLVVVGHTNRKALVDGAAGGQATVRTVDSRPHRDRLVDGRSRHPRRVDRPDHYP